MGVKYTIEGYLNGCCKRPQAVATCEFFITFIFTFMIYSFKYPIVNVRYRDGYMGCRNCKLDNEKLTCRVEKLEK